MKVRLTVHRPDLNKVPGDVITVEEERGLRLLQAGQAVAVAEAPEAAVDSPEETAALPKAQQPKKGKGR